MSTPILVLAVVLDIVVTAAILWLFLARRKTGGPLLGTSWSELKQFADASHTMVGEYLRANYNGQPEQLPEVLESLLARLEEQARTQGLALDRETLRWLLQRSVEAHRLTKARELEVALDKVA